ncbi:Ser/Thr protein phosphatase family protein [Chondromyces apiculatus DSM 436]|uniref:Ser/Thr protein phosphatase family protein n=1 Tax=Chondromyces apiculatus DSM 436 TaxID=1192034 RepID=A0A017T0T1_9BACT|nr:Ser/Thr protein phosphatase family protein [Chondromyces apiculatus DSM 436]
MDAQPSKVKLSSYLKRLWPERAARDKAGPPPTWPAVDDVAGGIEEDEGGLSPAQRGAIQLRRFAGPTAYLDQLSPIRIAHLTDQHVGRVTPMKLQREAVDLTNKQRPDLVMLTGDFVCHSQLYLDQLEELIRSFEAPVFAVLGNHDHWSGGDEVKQTLRRAGAEVLCNAHTVVTVRHQALQVVGLDDAYTGHAQRERAVKGLRKNLPSIGLSHIAEEADGLWRHGVPLVLSGHTHAGQVTVARLHEFSIGKLAGHKYVHGLYGTRTPEASGQGAVYVGAGIGASVLPFRIGDRGQREVAIFDLGEAPGSFEEHHAEQLPLKGRKPSLTVQAKRAEQVVKKREKRARKRPSALSSRP